jgi:putative transposase
VYKYRLYPNKTQIKDLDRLFWKARSLYNLGIQIERSLHEYQMPYLSHYDLRNKLIEIRRENDYYASDLPSHTIDAIAERVHLSYQKFFKDMRDWKKGTLKRWKNNPITGERENHPPNPPKMKTYMGKNYFSSIPYRTSGYKLTVVDSIKKKAFLKLNGVGQINLVYHREIPKNAQIKRAIVMRKPNGKFYVAFQCEIAKPNYPAITGKQVGIDMGLSCLLAFSDGRELLKNPKWYFEAKKQRRILGRKADRQRRANNPNNYNADKTPKTKVKWIYSNRAKQTLKQQRNLEEHIAQQRWNFWHEVTDMLTREYDLIVLEDLNLKFMQANEKLAGHVYDAALGMFRSMLQYKADERGVRIIIVDPAYTSQTCPECNHVCPENRPTRSSFCCVKCGYSGHADETAARNILKRGLSELRAEIAV